MKNFAVVGLVLVSLVLMGMDNKHHHHTVSLTWTASVTQGVAYNVYRTPEGFSNFSRVGSDINGTSFTDSGVLNGQGYTYYVTSVEGGEESVPSNEVTVTIP